MPTCQYGSFQILISCRLVSRFFLNLRSVAYDNPILASQATTGFALDNTSPRTLIAEIMRRNPARQNTMETLSDMGTRPQIDEVLDVVDISGDQTSIVNTDCEAGREMGELRPAEG